MEILKRHTASIYAPSLNIEANELLDPIQFPSQAIRCLIYPVPASQAFEDFNLNVERPHILITEDGDSLQEGGMVIHNSRTFHIRGQIRKFYTSEAVDHVECILEEKV